MIINHNLGAINAQRNMGINSGAAAKSMEKLSSGLRINRAGDDAAGLSISEKMRAQIRGLDQASTNAEDGISMIQTAEGALTETHSILQRMRELSVQSANDTNVSTDRAAIQAEMDELTKEVDRIATTTEFNTQKLLDGSFSGTFQIGANEGQKMDLNIGKMDSASLGLTSTVEISETKDLTADSNIKDGTYTVEGTNIKDTNGNIVGSTDGAKLTFNTKDTTFTDSKILNGATVEIKDGKVTVTNKLDTATAAKNLTSLAPGSYEVKGTNLIKDGELVGTVDTGNKKIILNDKTEIAEADLGFADGKLKDGVKFTVNGSDVSTQKNAAGTIETVNAAIEKVSTQRSKLGAVQNRLEHTVNNLNTSSENLTAAESRIRDTDMASEMSEYSKNNILQQAAQAMLAQAKSAPEQVLQLLR
ncbi:MULTISPECIES: flagellin [Clostridium]|uniref:flagellin N-terminal helical domain-containing protein n=1 Tax=Clostridium TaxID=1485 RepID=UPI0006A7BC18|nr:MULTISPECIES: flagellin [Clostridium]AXB85911.1 flagellin [Clostridium butyricum]MDB2154365.1 flagellin [Clostridium butyricum]MDU6541517.1 flagellin [Clostridium sp.]